VFLPHETDVPVSRESFADAELREDHIQELFHINPAGDPSKRRCSGAKALCAQVQVMSRQSLYNEF
jgi:hypothetical protein